jgi:SAM-dependent methyltransferase
MMNRWHQLYAVDQLPVFQNRMFHTPEEARACTKGDVVLAQDLETGLVFNRAFRPELLEYDAEYQNEQAVSPMFQGHLKEAAAIVARHLARRTLIEVGCGKGFFLEYLQAQGFDIAGLDPIYEGTNPVIRKEYFTPATGLHADGVILRHVLEHIPDPVGFLDNVRRSNGGQGTIYIEVPCFDWICRHRSWFDIFYEHVNYFRIGDFDRMFGRVYESGRVFGGQYLYVVADLSTLRQPVWADGTRADFPADFLGTVDRYASMLKRPDAPAHTVVWGGASKGVTFSLFMERAGVTVSTIVDINPAKQGRYLPATGLRVSSPDEALRDLEGGADILVMNSNYLPEIQQLTNHRFNYLAVDGGVA